MRFGVTTMALDPPERFCELVRVTEAGGFDELSVWIQRIKDLIALGVRHVNVFLMSADRLAMVHDLATKVLPHVRA